MVLPARYQSYAIIHFCVLLWGFTGLFGRWISLHEVPLVWNRLLICVPMLAALGIATKAFRGFKWNTLGKPIYVGILIAIHWVLFYGAVKYSNASVGASCLSMVAVYSSFLEPIINKRSIRWVDVLLAVIAAVGMLFIFRAQPGYFTGIILGLLAALFSSYFTILNKDLSPHYHPIALSFYELTSALVFITVMLPVYFHFFPTAVLTPGKTDIELLFLFAIGATIVPFVLSLYALRDVSAFFSNLSLNLEPVYTIILAMFFFHEQTELHTGFYIGAGLILMSVVLYVVLRSGKITIPIET